MQKKKGTEDRTKTDECTEKKKPEDVTRDDFCQPGFQNTEAMSILCTATISSVQHTAKHQAASKKDLDAIPKHQDSS